MFSLIVIILIVALVIGVFFNETRSPESCQRNMKKIEDYPEFNSPTHLYLKSLNEGVRKLQEADEKKKQEQRGLIQQEYDSFKGRKYIDM